jgi:DNA-binding Lrp family transcriptional regulator
MQILKLLSENGQRGIFSSYPSSQSELAEKLQVTRQALSVHIKRLRESGFVQVGRGFINVTQDGLKATGYNPNAVIVMIRVSPQSRRDAFEKIRALVSCEIFRVAGEWDIVLVVQQDDLDQILASLSAIEGVLESKSLISIEAIR